MIAITLQEAQSRLADVIHTLTPGAELLITENNQPMAMLVGQALPTRQARSPGSAKGRLAIHAEDDEHLADFKEYMP